MHSSNTSVSEVDFNILLSVRSGTFTVNKSSSGNVVVNKLLLESELLIKKNIYWFYVRDRKVSKKNLLQLLTKRCFKHR